LTDWHWIIADTIQFKFGSKIIAATETFGETLQDKDGDHIVVTKSTVISTTTSETLLRSSNTCLIPSSTPELPTSASSLAICTKERIPTLRRA
jgi:hypothetical protein